MGRATCRAVICARTLAAHSPRGYSYYRCLGKNPDNFAPGQGRCDCKNHRTDALDEKIWSALSEYLSKPALIAKPIEERLKAEARNDFDRDLEGLYKTREKIKRDDARLLAAYEGGVYELDELREHREGIKKRKAAIEAEIATLTLRKQEYRQHAAHRQSIQSIVQLAPARMATMTFEERRRTLDIFNIRVYIYNNPDRAVITGYLTQELTVYFDSFEPVAPAYHVLNSTRNETGFQPIPIHINVLLPTKVADLAPV